jgi:hypothetical protein
MKLHNKVVVVIAILLFITIHPKHSRQEMPAGHTNYSTTPVKETDTGIDLFNPSNIILVKLP